MICPKCKKEVPDGMKFCRWCGAKLPEENTTQQAGNYQQQAGNYQQQAGNYQQQAGNYQQQAGNYQQQAHNNQQQRTQEAEWISKNVNAASKTFAQVPGEALAILKRPVTRVKELCDMGATSIGWGFIAVKTIVWILLAVIAISKINSSLGGYIELPMFKPILAVITFTLGLDVLEAFLSKYMTNLFKGKTSFENMIVVVGSRALYDTLYIVIVILCYFISPKISIALYALLQPIGYYIQYSGYQKNVMLEEDKKPYTFFVIKTVVAIVVAIVVYMLLQSIGDSVGSLMGGYMDVLDYL